MISFMDISFHKFQNWANATLNFDSTTYSKAICAGHFEKCYVHFHYISNLTAYPLPNWPKLYNTCTKWDEQEREFLFAISAFVLASLAVGGWSRTFYVLHVISKLLESFLGPLGRPLLSIVPYALCLMRSDPLLFEAKNSIHGIYKDSKSGNSKKLRLFLVIAMYCQASSSQIR